MSSHNFKEGIFSQFNFLKDDLLGFLDPVGNLVVSTGKEMHIDPYKEENLNFFKKIQFNDRLKEFKET